MSRATTGSAARSLERAACSDLCPMNSSAAVRTPVYPSVTLAGSCDGGCRYCCACLIDVHQGAAQTELTEVAIGPLDARRVLHVPRFHRVEAGSLDQALSRRSCLGVVGRIEEHGAPWRSIGALRERCRAQRAECLSIVRFGWQEPGDHRGRRLALRERACKRAAASFEI